MKTNYGKAELQRQFETEEDNNGELAMQGGEKYKLSKNKEEQYLRMLKLQQSENKQ